jgi:hypothetical protein
MTFVLNSGKIANLIYNSALLQAERSLTQSDSGTSHSRATQMAEADLEKNRQFQEASQTLLQSTNEQQTKGHPNLQKRTSPSVLEALTIPATAPAAIEANSAILRTVRIYLDESVPHGDFPRSIINGVDCLPSAPTIPGAAFGTHTIGQTLSTTQSYGAARSTATESKNLVAWWRRNIVGMALAVAVVLALALTVL